MLPRRVRRVFRLLARGDPALRAARREADLDEEIRFHLDQRIAHLVARGLPPDEARRRAVAKFGSIDEARARLRHSARHREDRVFIRERLDAVRHDLRATLRTIRATPGFTAVVVLTLALGIGANAAIFSVVDATLLRPLPYAEPERLVYFGDREVGTTGEASSTSYPELVEWIERTGGMFTGVGAYFTSELTLSGDGEPEMLEGARVSAALPSLLGATLIHGRTFRAEEEARGAERVAILSEPLWRRRFAADPSVVGRVVSFNGFPHTVVGVMRAGRGDILPDGLETGQRIDAWIPLRLDAEVAPFGLHFLTVLGRLRPGVSLEAARARVGVMSVKVDTSAGPAHGMQVTSLTTHLVGDVRQRLLLLLGAVGLVLLIACANIANLLLARAATRQREIAIRVALGAGRGRVALQFLAESLVRALIGGAVSVLVAYGIVAAVRRWLPARVPRFDEVAVDGRVLLFALALSVVTGLLFGLAPALRAVRQDAGGLLREGGRGLAGSLRQDRVRALLVIGEVALSFVLLTGAGLLLQSFARLSAVDKGFDAEHTLVAFVSLPYTRYGDNARQAAFFDRLLERVSALPGVQAAAIASDLPVEGGTNGGFAVEGMTFAPGSEPLAEKRVVSAGYFTLLRARMLAGREFDARDVSGAPPVMIVNESFARGWLGADRGGAEAAIGRRAGFLWEIEGMQTVVGVVADVREGALDRPAAPAMYVPAAQLPFSSMKLLVRSAGDPLDLVASLRREVMALDKELPIARVRTLDAVVANGTAPQRLSATLVGGFSLLALLLAAVGLYGVISYSVAQRTREMGVRTALGATRSDVVKLVLGPGMRLVTMGLVVGLGLALALSRVLASQLFGVEAHDVGTLVGTALILFVVALVATAAPTLRATRIDPLVALRSD